MLQKPVFALLGCQQISVNTLLCHTLERAENPFSPCSRLAQFKPLSSGAPWGFLHLLSLAGPGACGGFIVASAISEMGRSQHARSSSSKPLPEPFI